MENLLVDARGLTKMYGSFTALDHVNIQVRRGEIYGLVGDNGAGKSTFLKLVAGHIFKTDGELYLFGQHLQNAMDTERKRMGTIIENPGFYPQLSIEKNLEYYRIQKGIPGKTAVDEVVKAVGLDGIRKKKCRNLSMGQKQRLGLAIALIGEPELLILDEPINGLDPSGIIEIRQLLKKLNEEKNMTIILSSHILPELEQVATVYGFLDHGHMAEQISARSLMERCASYVEIKVSNQEHYTVFLESILNHTDYQVMPDGTIHIFHPQHDIQAYSQLASENHLDIYKLEMCRMTLEDYYMNLKNGGRK